MTTPISRSAYRDCYEILDQALESPRGVQRLFQTRGDAYHFRAKLHQARAYDRQNNRRIYQPDDPLYNQTLYSAITVRQPRWDQDREKWVLRLEKSIVGEMEVEEIPGPKIEIKEEDIVQVDYDELGEDNELHEILEEKSVRR